MVPATKNRQNGKLPKFGGWHLFLAEAGFPVARLHDVRWPSPDACDVSTIFPLAHLDPDDPKNYLFAKTDDYLAAILAAKSKIVYRLGQSIEPWSKYHTHPPRDMDRFARVCVNIIRHYNDGWADGFHHGITHWEIWNEPDMKLPLMWLGSQEDYFRLYETVARAIKAHDPKLKVGGPALTSMSSDWARPFVAHCRDRKLPLDFFSFHVYSAKPQVLVDSCRRRGSCSTSTASPTRKSISTSGGITPPGTACGPMTRKSMWTCRGGSPVARVARGRPSRPPCSCGSRTSRWT